MDEYTQETRHFHFNFFIFSGVVIVSLLASLLFINAKIGGDLLGNSIKNVKIVKSETGKNILKIDYGRFIFNEAKYRVKLMDKGEELLLPDRLLAEDGGSLGEYRIEIMFIDVRGSTQLTTEYPSKTVHKLKEVPIELNSKYNIRIAYPPDDSSFVIYIGSDEPINIKDQNITKIDCAKGSIELAFED